MLEAETDDHEIEIALRETQQSPRRVRLTLDVMFGAERLDDTVGRTVTILDENNASAASELIEPDAHSRGETHLLLGRGAHQHLVGQHLEAREILHPRDERDIVDRLGEEVVGSRLEPLHAV